MWAIGQPSFPPIDQSPIDSGEPENRESVFNRGKKYYSIFPLNVNRKFYRFMVPRRLFFTRAVWILQIFHARTLAFTTGSYIVTGSSINRFRRRKNTKAIALHRRLRMRNFIYGGIIYIWKPSIAPIAADRFHQPNFAVPAGAAASAKQKRAQPRPCRPRSIPKRTG